MTVKEQQNQIFAFTPSLLAWYHQNARILPWRSDPTPYHVWVSEIMLQQTRVEAVKGYYQKFMAVYPDIFSLADADEEQLAKCWEGLGYYSRMRNLLRCAKLVCEQRNGILPNEYSQLLKLPGIGSYTAGAVASIAYGKKVPAVDGNVLRVLSRILSIDTPIDAPKTKQMFFDLLLDVMPDEAGAFNQALMELGAVVCLPNGAPLCDACPVKDFCTAHQNANELAFPVKLPKKTRRIEQITYLLLRTPHGFVLHKRPNKGLLASLWEYPNLPGKCDEAEILSHLQSKQVQVNSIQKLADKKHIFTHIEWQITGYLIDCIYPVLDENEVIASEEQMQQEYAIPTAFDQYERSCL